MARHIYVHNPFCVRKCPYCDFYSVTDCSCAEAFYKAAVREVKLIGSVTDENTGTNLLTDIDNKDTVYFGGGTPTVPDSRFVCELLGEIKKAFKIAPDAEITIEANPSSVTSEKLTEYLQAGFNRISLGVQSLDDEVLKVLGRLHDSKGAIDALKKISDAGFTNISADLITGVPGETLDGIKRDIDAFRALGVKHISTYSLMLEEGTPFYDKYNRTIEEYISPELEREMYHGTREFLNESGYETYEISNSCMPGFRSIHNSSYWNSCEYFAIGAGAHGFLGDMRYGHRDDVRAYIEEMNTITSDTYKAFLEGNVSGLKSLYIEEELSREDKMREVAFLRLRTSDGILLDEFKKVFGVEFEDVFADAVKTNIEKGLLERKERTLRLTRSGLDLANIVIEDFL
ncbi:MAG: radical SAM family heme chaperone HemW [Clostridiales bacterium]|nr:radical SAM family heme chaperone HemW [Clostridiales bacterium]